MSVKIIYPPRPKSKMPPNELAFYESTGKWVGQRKFRGSGSVLHISPNKEITFGSRHGRPFAKFDLDKKYREEILSGLNLESGVSYCFHGELMNKDENATNEIIFYDLLEKGRYLFGSPDQEARLEMLSEACGNPKELCQSKIALQVTPRIWLAEVFSSDFISRFNEALPVPQLEGLVLRKKKSCLDNFGHSEYETTNIIRCRKSFGCDTPKAGRSGGYQF